MPRSPHRSPRGSTIAPGRSIILAFIIISRSFSINIAYTISLSSRLLNVPMNIRRTTTLHTLTPRLPIKKPSTMLTTRPNRIVFARTRSPANRLISHLTRRLSTTRPKPIPRHPRGHTKFRRILLRNNSRSRRHFTVDPTPNRHIRAQLHHVHPQRTTLKKLRRPHNPIRPSPFQTTKIRFN